MTVPDIIFMPVASQSPNGSAMFPALESGRTQITPAIAREWLEIDVIKRKIYQRKVAEFVRDMKAGKWVLNGETIKRSKNGGILDGRHRLTAVAESGVTIESFVVHGLEDSTQKTVDLGTARSFANQLEMAGVANSALVAAITKRAWRWLHGHRGNGGPNPTPAEAEELLNSVPILIEATSFAVSAVKKFPYIRGTVWGTSYLIFSEVLNLAAREFLDQVVTGENLPKGSPALAMRNRAMSDSRLDKRPTEAEQLAQMILAWNAWREGRTLSGIQLPRGGLKPSNFPVPAK